MKLRPLYGHLPSVTSSSVNTHHRSEGNASQLLKCCNKGDFSGWREDISGVINLTI